MAVHHMGEWPGGGDWTDTAIFLLVAAAFGLSSGRGEGRDELVVWVSLDRFPEIVTVIQRLGEDADAWPWLHEEDPDRQIALAATVLGITEGAVAANPDLLEALRVE